MIFRRHVEPGCLAIFSHGASGYGVGVSLLENEAGLPGIHRDAGSEVSASMLLAMAGIRDGDAIKRGRSQCGRLRLLGSRHGPQCCELDARLLLACLPTSQAHPANHVCKQQPSGKCPNTSTKVYFAFPFFVPGATLSVILISYTAWE
jgi:hypothetical protein